MLIIKETKRFDSYVMANLHQWLVRIDKGIDQNASEMFPTKILMH